MHFEQGRDYRRAIKYLEQAGQNALRRSAHQEAISLLTRGLELLKTLPHSSDHMQKELSLQITLGTPLIATKGYGVSEVEQVYRRARELCSQLEGNARQIFPALLGLRVFHLVRAEYQTALEIAKELLRIAQETKDQIFLLAAHQTIGEVMYFQGEFTSALEHCDQAIALYDPLLPRPPWMWLDFVLPCLTYSASMLWYFGYPDQAKERSQKAIVRAQELGHPFSMAWALNFTGTVLILRREPLLVQENSEVLTALCYEYGFPQWLSSSALRRGWAFVEQGQGEEGIVQMRKGIAAWQATGANTGASTFLTWLAESHGKAGQPTKGLIAIAEALVFVGKNGERVFEAELYRLKGELTLQKFKVPSYRSPLPDAQTEAEACFHKAIDIARRQQAKSLELRATMSLARLWQQQGKTTEARQMLAAIYNWFTEGFDTKDLQEAKTLLEELRR